MKQRVKPKNEPVAAHELSPGLRRYLYFTAATTGAASRKAKDVSAPKGRRSGRMSVGKRAGGVCGSPWVKNIGADLPGAFV